MKAFIPYGKQWIDESDIESVVKVLKSDWLTQGPVIEQFERAIADYCGAKYAVAVSSGTAALYIACLVAGLGKNDYLWTSPNTFIASANCALYCGARPDFVDIDSLTYNISIDELEAKLYEAKKRERLPKVVIPVHFAGHSCEMEKIYELSHKYNLKVIEDACHALGGFYQDSKVGSCTFSDMTIFSFHPAKHITTGEGGMITTNNHKYYMELLSLRNHGIERNPDRFLNHDMAFTGDNYNLWYYEMHGIGFNYRITDIQSALGLSQLNRIDLFVQKRREIASFYNNIFKNVSGLTIPVEKEGILSSYHLYPLQIDFKKMGVARNDLIKKLKDKNIGTQVHYIPVHLQPYYRRTYGYKNGDFPNAEDYYENVLSLPIYPLMTDEDINYVSSTLLENLEVVR